MNSNRNMSNKFFPRVFVFLFIAGLFLVLPRDAGAVSQWARKYEVDCTMCHTAFPRLTHFGERFMRNGFQWPDDEPDEVWLHWHQVRSPFHAVIERGAICSRCGQEAQVLFFDPRIDTAEDMREAALLHIEEYRQQVETDPESACRAHKLLTDWAAPRRPAPFDSLTK